LSFLYQFWPLAAFFGNFYAIGNVVEAIHAEKNHQKLASGGKFSSFYIQL
jgi:hypothetical protein